MTQTDELRPQPLRLKRKPEGRIQDLEPSQLFHKPIDLSTSKCSGVINGPGVIVTTPSHIWALVRQGAYGKGVFSRSIPCHHHIPSLGELQKMSKRQGTPGICGKEIEGSWKKRIKLHSEWIAEGEGISNETETTPVKDENSRGDTEMKDEECSGHIEMKDDEYQEFVTRLKEIKDPYIMEEYLQLCAEEAFYLTAETKILNVTTTEATKLTEKDLWVHFSELDRSFYARYAAYRHYRMGNWVPKSGLKFGVDYLLYKEGPLFYHSSFAVVIRETEGDSKDGLKWREVIALGRVNEAAGKDLLVCHVTRPQGILKSQLREPACIESVAIKDVLISRWLPEKDREA